MVIFLLKVLITHFTGGFFLALAVVTFYRGREIGDFTQDLFGGAKWTRSFMKSRLNLFLGVLAAGFPALIVFTVRNSWKLIKDQKLI